jgi:hypothetical protein
MAMAMAMAETPPIADESLRMSALRAIFPGMPISLVPGKRIDDSWPAKQEPHELYGPDTLGERLSRNR